MSLANVLTANKHILGANYENLGRARGGFRKKTYLSCNNKNWTLVQLNLLQRILRKIGFYHSTHDKNILLAKAKYEHRYHWKDERLDARMQALWNRTHPHKKFPLFSKDEITKKPAAKVRIDGNCTSEKKVKIFCFAEKHTKSDFRGYTAKTINRLYRPGDIILVESVENTEKGYVRDCSSRSLKDINPDFEVQGWDLRVKIEGFNKVNNKVNEFDELFKPILDIPKDTPRAQRRQIWTQTLEKLREKMPEFVNFFYKDNIQNAKKVEIDAKLESLLKKLKVGEPCAKEFADFRSIVEDFYKQIPKARYRHFTREDDRKVFATFQARNQSMIEVIQKHRAAGKRIFILGGCAHFLNTERGQMNSLPVQKELKKHKYQIHTSEKVLKKYKFLPAFIIKLLPSKSMDTQVHSKIGIE
jgi:hypothetical protein